MLDVKLRSSKVRARRVRLAAIGLGSFFTIVLGAYLLWCAGEWALNMFVYRNQAFAIQVIDIDTDGVLSIDQLKRWIAVKPQDNLLAVDLTRVERDLKLVPAIQSVSIERILPSTLRIRVVEREPVAEIHAPRPRAGGGIEMGVFQLDADGVVMLPLEPVQRAAGAPPAPELTVIAGVSPTQLQPGRRIQNSQVDAALRLLLAFERSPMAGLVDAKKIEVSSPEVLVLTTGQGSVVTFGMTSPEQQLRRWREIFDRCQRLGKVIGTLDLAVPNHIPLTWLEASTAPDPEPKARKTPANRKKNV